MPPKNTDFDKSTTDELIKYVVEQTGAPISKPDAKIMQKSSLTGFSLVYCGTEEAFKQEGLSWGTRTSRMRIKQDYLRKKGQAPFSLDHIILLLTFILGMTDKAELADYEPEKRLQVAFQADLAQSEGPSRAHIQEGSGDTTDTQKSIQRRDEYAARHVKLAQEQASTLRSVAKLCEEKRRQIINFFDRNFKDWDDAKAKLSSPNISVDLPFPFLGTMVPKRFMIRKDQRSYRYMGREVFFDLLEAFKSVTQSLGLKICGYTASWATANHTCSQSSHASSQRTAIGSFISPIAVFVKETCSLPSRCLLFTWADSPEKTEEIIGLQDMDDVERFVTRTWSTSVIFVVDQLNALDGEHEAQTKAQVRHWLDRFRFDAKTVFSTSANNISFHRTTLQQNNDYLFTVFVGYTRVY